MTAGHNPDAPVREIRCHHADCDASYRDHRWGMTKAHGDGWMIQRNGTSWCPEHLPAWVAEWRERRSRRD